MKKRIIVALLLLATIGTSGIRYNYIKNPEVINIEAEMDWDKSYNTVEDLSKDAEIIVKGKILNTRSYVSRNCIITEYDLKVDKSYNDNAKEDDIVTIATAGGTISYNKYKKYMKKDFLNFDVSTLNSLLYNTQIRLKFNEFDLIEKNKEYIIFADKEKVEEEGTIKEMYCSLNVGQGQFLVNNGMAKNTALNYDEDLETLEETISQE